MSSSQENEEEKKCFPPCNSSTTTLSDSFTESTVIFNAADRHCNQEMKKEVMTKEEQEVVKKNVLALKKRKKKPVAKKMKKNKKKNNLTGVNVKAVRAENLRLKRLEEKEASFKEALFILIKLAKDDPALVKRILDFDEKTKEPLVLLDAELAKLLKPYQVEGVQFMYNSVVGSVEELEHEKEEKGEGGGGGGGGGCILAHSMGLGKTFQVFALLHALLTSKSAVAENFQRILIIVPYNVVENWALEFEKWDAQCDRRFPLRLFEMRLEPNLSGRLRLLRKWRTTGGVLFISSALFERIVGGMGKLKKENDRVTVSQCLLRDPGPQLVIVDEGHLMKNAKGQLAQALAQITGTGRRILLTGTPLQNNLAEYFTMVNYVRPGLLGTSRRAFIRRFQRPIEKGQAKDCQAKEGAKMKRLTKSLIKLLRGTVHRRDHTVLLEYLPPKTEYVLTVALTPVQIELYKRYLDMFAGKLTGLKGGLETILENSVPALSKLFFRDLSLLSMVWAHPILLREYYLKAAKSTSAKAKRGEGKRGSKECEVDNFIAKIGITWLSQLPDSTKNGAEIVPEMSNKTVLFFAILDAAEAVGDKVVLFSQSLLLLDLLERLLEQKANQFAESDEEEEEGARGWSIDADYLRIDGSVDCSERSELIDRFNNPAEKRARLMLVSTRAGGVGINLIGANRAVLYDASFNPATDLQALFRLYRLGQTKPVFIYRLIAYGTMEAKMYKRQVQKQSLSRRVVDQKQVTRHYRKSDLEEMYLLEEEYDDLGLEDFEPVLEAKPDGLLSGIISKFRPIVISLHEHDDLLEKGGFVEEDSESSEVSSDKISEKSSSSSDHS